MSIELIRKAVCDKCGKECYHIVEKTFNEDVCEQYKIARKRILDSVYHYTEIALRGFDSRFGESSETTFVLCGDCVSDLGEWLKHPTEKKQKKKKAESIKEFAERVKAIIPNIDDSYIERMVEEHIDNLVKEMAGDN